MQFLHSMEKKYLLSWGKVWALIVLVVAVTSLYCLFTLSTKKLVNERVTENDEIKKHFKPFPVSAPASLDQNSNSTFALQNAPVGSMQDLNGITIDISYKLNVPPEWWAGMDTSPPYEKLMNDLHGMNIWEDKEGMLSRHIDALDINGTDAPFGSPLMGRSSGGGLDLALQNLLLERKPRIFLEVGVFAGATSSGIANFFKSNEGFENSYVISVDNWLLDVTFTKRGAKSKYKAGASQNWSGRRLAGGSSMYYQFLANCIKMNTTDRIIPLPTASSSGALTLLSHGVRPDFMYIDASHANPDVIIDAENFYTILKPGGLMAFDDVDTPAVKVAFDLLVRRYGLNPKKISSSQAFVVKPV